MNPSESNHRAPSRRLATFAVAAAALVACAAPAVASAATDRWVDSDTGSDAGGNTCTVEASPCKTISQASTVSQLAGNAGTIHVDQGSYGESVNIAQSNRLLADDFVHGDGGDETTISGGGNAGAAVFVQANASISGFTIASSTSASSVLVTDNAGVDGNTIYAEADNSNAVEILASTGHPTVTGNTIIAGSGDEKNGVRVNQNVASATVADNAIGSASQGFDTGIDVRQNSSADISGNVIQGLNQRFGSNARGIAVTGADSVTISRNRIDSPLHLPGDEVSGVTVDALDAEGTVALDHNELIGLTGIGLTFTDSAGTITSEGDVVARIADRGIYAGNVADLRITNDTIVDAGYMDVGNSHLTIDSSIFDDPINSGADSTCAITYSRGPAIVQGGDGCGEFQTTLDPAFVDQFGATPDLHLSPDSPLIDAGNPAAPPAGAVDIDGDARALEGDGECPIDAERDMGADEVVAALPDCRVPPPPPPPAKDTKPPQTAVAGKHRQRGNRARFMLRSSEAGSTFECRIDRGRFAACPPDYRSPRLAFGKHRIVVRAIDKAGNRDATPSVKRFRLKPKPR